MADLTLAIKNVDWNDNDTQFDAGQEEVDKLDAIGEEKSEPVATNQPSRDQQPSHAVAAGIQFSKGQSLDSPIFPVID